MTRLVLNKLKDINNDCIVRLIDFQIVDKDLILVKEKDQGDLISCIKDY
jgi:hypothetical protein